MNQFLRNAMMTLVLGVLVSGNVKAQMTTQVVSINPQYTNQTFYSMNNGIVSSVSNTDWDLGFQLRGFAGSILINSKNSVKLYRANKDVSQWAAMTTSDTTGIVGNTAYELFNSDTSWDYGAFNVTNDPSNPFDLGWGVYDFVSHVITGDSLYFIKLPGGIYKKFQMIDLGGGVYNFKWADLDGSNEQIRSLNKTTYLGKFFAYYSILNDVAIDREPAYNAWDLSFQQYLTLTPYIYPVTGVLLNDSVRAAKMYPVDTATAYLGSATFEDRINTIGYDWKTFDMTSFTWVIADSTVYFVQDRQGNPWKMIFTGFGGSSNGNFTFQQSPAGTVGFGESENLQTLGLYPNPASTFARMALNVKAAAGVQVQIMDMSGRAVQVMQYEFAAGLQTIDLDLRGLTPGLYTVMAVSGNDRQVSRLVVN